MNTTTTSVDGAVSAGGHSQWNVAIYIQVYGENITVKHIAQSCPIFYDQNLIREQQNGFITFLLSTIAFRLLRRTQKLKRR